MGRDAPDMPLRAAVVGYTFESGTNIDVPQRPSISQAEDTRSELRIRLQLAVHRDHQQRDAPVAKVIGKCRQ